MRSGIGIGLLSGAKNKKVITIVGAVMIVIGIGGMIAVGSQAADILSTRGVFGNPDLARSYFYGEYVFLFVMVAGLALTIFGVVSMQRKKKPASQ
ncbi:hypothetical protein Ngar_c11970 [Candidatus Nitrososphaera gargensis Ga9.2]|uniref:Uncharacterized protein n=1 Tax=Nitrososphaera gargensis (strain Ga9.2) TaxID=1237085 RepID=K0IJ16_NITGG|nr:hypothetical protein [Candidatus Nitrososphaera gargensis]AFU58137.1 hypothetical protein Ngar_c11970 [Candidatus Nitrososphaera gargensis Ga9.2]